MREGSTELWQVNEAEAKKFYDEMVAKFDVQRDKLNLRKRKYAGTDLIRQFEKVKAKNNTVMTMVESDIKAKKMTLNELLASRRSRIEELEKYEAMSEMFQRIVGQTNKELGQSIDLPSATSQFNSMIYRRKTQQQLVDQEARGPKAEESDLSEGEREVKHAQMDGFMLIYEMFRPLTTDYLNTITKEEQQQARLNQTTQNITSALK